MIYLLRHGETVANREGRLQGRSDSSLTLKGVTQIRAIAALLAREIGDPSLFTVVSSPLGRARQSAGIICQALAFDPGRVTCEPRLMEYGFGQWEDLRVGDIEAGAWAQREADRWNFAPPGGESYAMVAARVGSWLDEQEPGARLIVVCHGAVSRVLRGLYAGLPPAESVRLSQDQTNLYRLDAGRIETLKARLEPAGWSL